MIRSLLRKRDGTSRADLAPADYGPALREPEVFLWVDFEGEPAETCEPILRQTFGFHPLAIDDALAETHVPKIDDWETYIYVALHAVVFDRQDGGHIDTTELDAFLGKNLLVTHHDAKITAVDRIWNRCVKDGRLIGDGGDHVLYLIVDELVTAYLQVFEDMDDALDILEGQIFDAPTSATLESIFKIKRAILNLRRVLAPQREVINRLARDDYAVIDPRDRIYFRDVYDHLVRLYDINESMRDQVGGALDTYLSVINNKMNDIMKTLTIITTLFMPISFVTGFFGMNFFLPNAPLPAWTSWAAFAAMLVVVIGTPLVMFSWVRRRGWM